MKKLLMTVAVLGCAAVVTAQTVTSQNIVGYTKVTVTAGSLELVALNFDTGGLTVGDLIGDQLPGSSVVHLWDKTSRTYTTCNKGRAGWDPNPVVNLGDALWLDAGSGVNEVILSGEVLLADTNTVAMVTGVDALGYYYPVEVLFSTSDLAGQAPGSSVLHVWNGLNYDTFNKGRAGWDGDPTIGVADGFWLDTPSDFTWTEERPFTP